MTPDEQRRMALLEGTLREVRLISEQAKTTTGCMDPEVALDGVLLRRWRRLRKQIDSLV